MPTLNITKETGGRTMPGPMLVAEPERLVTKDTLSSFASGSGLNGPYVAGVLSKAAQHERNGIYLYQALAAISDNPATKPKFEQFKAESMQAVDAYEGLIADLGGDPQYVSPSARMTEAMDSKLVESLLLSGSADPEAREAAGVDAALVASTMCVANTALLERIAAGADEGPARDAMVQAAEKLRPDQEKHLEFAVTTQQKMAATLSKSELAEKAMDVAENLVGKIKGLLRG